MANVSLRGLEKHRLGGKEDWYPVFVSVMGTRITLVFKHHLCGGICESQKARILESKYSKTLFKKQREKEREGKEKEREPSSHHCFILPTSGDGPGWTQEPGTPSRSLI